MDELEQQYETHMRNCNRYLDMMRRSVEKYGENAVADSISEKLRREEEKLNEVTEEIHRQVDLISKP
jgi:hypothetical protein